MSLRKKVAGLLLLAQAMGSLLMVGCGSSSSSGDTAVADGSPGGGAPVPETPVPETPSPEPTVSGRQMERIDRGLVAVKTASGVYLGWRLLGLESYDAAFNLYRSGTKLNSTPITGSTNYQDASGTQTATYTVRAVVSGVEQADSAVATVWATPYLSIPIQKPADTTTPDGTYGYNANDASVGDLDGDGQYEIVLKWEANSKDNSSSGYTGNVLIDAYKLDGTRLWRIDLGRNIRAGAHYTQFMVYDFDGDGKAEVAMKTADGTVDGLGTVIGNAASDWRNSGGYILSGPEYLTMFKGANGQAMETINYLPLRGNVNDWGDGYGNRVDRFLAGVAYLDGQRPSLVMTRGYYTRTVIAAWDWRGGHFTQRWVFDTNTAGDQYKGQGNHSLAVADVDADGKDEIVFGAMTIDDNGSVLYSTSLGHGDAHHVGDLDPATPGLEVYKVMESTAATYGFALWNAATGAIRWGYHTGKDTGRGAAGDIDPRHPGAEMWAQSKVYSAQGAQVSNTAPAANFVIWWDGDLSREILDHNWISSIRTGVGRIDKWNYASGNTTALLTATGTYSNNDTKGTPALQADLVGDWREEVIWRTQDNTELRLYTTTAETSTKLRTLMHDPVYRLAIAWQNVGYNQPPHTGFFLGTGMTPPPALELYFP